MESEEFNNLVQKFKSWRKESPKSRHYPKDLKEKSVEIVNSGFPINRFCDATGVHPTTLAGWRERKKKKSFKAASILPSPKTTNKLTVIIGVDINDLEHILSIVQ